MLMNNAKNAFLLVFGVALINGCATMSKEECMKADWYLKGVDDASVGYPLDRVVEHGKACARVHIVPDMKAYRSGHEKGARLFCKPEKGFVFGREGGTYSGMCPADLEPTFLTAYNDGLELYSVEEKIKSLEYSISFNNNSIIDHNKEMAELNRDIPYVVDESERRRKMQRMDELIRDIERIQLDTDLAVNQLPRARRKLVEVKEDLYRKGYTNL